MPLMNASQMKASLCSVLETTQTHTTEYLQILVQALAWFLLGRGKRAPRKHFIWCLDKDAVHRYNSSVVRLAFINITRSVDTTKDHQHLQLVQSHAFNLVGCYVVLKSLLPVFPLILLCRAFNLYIQNLQLPWLQSVDLIVMSTAQHSQFIKLPKNPLIDQLL